MTRLILILAIILASLICFNGYKKVVVDSYKDTSTQIRKAGHR